MQEGQSTIRQIQGHEVKITRLGNPGSSLTYDVDGKFCFDLAEMTRTFGSSFAREVLSLIEVERL